MNLHGLNKENLVWVVIGFSGQFFFSLRFLLQWLHSERKRESMIPTSFWIFSIIGSLLLLLYAIYRRDPVFILGQAFGSLVYIRNLQFIYRKKLT